MSAEPTTHDPEDHSSFIKSPRQLITLVVLAFAVPTVLIILVARTVVSARSPSPAAMTPEAIAERIRPVADVAIAGQTRPEPATAAKPTAAATAKAAPQTGEQVYNAVCAACHQAGVANAPKFGDKAAWAKLIEEGLDKLTEESIKGVRAMPPRGGNPNLSDLEMKRAVAYMANAAGANFKAPAAPAAAKAAAAPAAAAPAPKPAATAAARAPAAAPAAEGKGKEVYSKACVVCHGQGVAGAPKLGDKSAWTPRLAAGIDTLYANSIKGKGAMPPKGGQLQLADAAVRAAVDYMVAAVK
ncbi:MAG: c-type cytochrome [Burkholderiales bacterium]|nr:c-type cytochrome [Burkholderiales bacterium]